MTDEQKGYCSVAFKILKKANKPLHINGIGNQYRTGKWFEISDENTWTEEFPWNHYKVEVALNTLCKLEYLSSPQKGLYELDKRGIKYDSFEEGEKARIKEEKHPEKILELAKEANNISKQSNTLSEKSNKIAKGANALSIKANQKAKNANLWAFFSALFAFLVLLFEIVKALGWLD